MKMTSKSMEERTGLRSLELVYRPVFDWETHSRECYQSQLRINGANMGILLPWQYLPVAERTDQCCQLGKWAVEQLCADCAALQKRGVAFEWLSVYCSLRLLAAEDFCEFIGETLSRQEIEPEKICIEVPAALLYPHDPQVDRTLRTLRQNGMRVLLSEFGDSSCPVLQLAQVQADIVQLAESVCAYLLDPEDEQDDRQRAAAYSLVQLVTGQGLSLIADGVATRSQAEAAAGRGCIRTTGEFAGAYVHRSGIRA